MDSKINKKFHWSKLARGKEGFTLIEVMIALAIFGVFIVSFMAGQGYNVSDSTKIRRELKLKELAQNKMNELIVTPPEFKESITLSKETGKFENDPDYKFEITYKKFKIPDLEKIKGKEEGEDEGSALQKKIFEMVKKNMEEIIWQVEVNVIDTNTEYSYSVSSWMANEKAIIKLDAL